MYGTIKTIACSLPEVTESPHFEKTSFRVRKKIFLTYDAKSNIATIKLSAIDQDIFCKMDKANVYPVNNKWGLQGWTCLELAGAQKELVEDAIKAAYCEVAPVSLSKLVTPDEAE